MSQGIAFSGNVPTAICNNAKRKRQMIHWLCHYAMYAIQLEHTEKSAMSAGKMKLNSCTGICKKYQFRIKGNSSKKRYDLGASRCNYGCETFIMWDGLYCPCCSKRLRKHSRNQNRNRAKLQEEKIKIPSINN